MGGRGDVASTVAAVSAPIQTPANSRFCESCRTVIGKWLRVRQRVAPCRVCGEEAVFEGFEKRGDGGRRTVRWLEIKRCNCKREEKR
jgi:hypothetical protein